MLEAQSRRDAREPDVEEVGAAFRRSAEANHVAVTSSSSAGQGRLELMSSFCRHVFRSEAYRRVQDNVSVGLARGGDPEDPQASNSQYPKAAQSQAPHRRQAEQAVRAYASERVPRRNEGADAFPPKPRFEPLRLKRPEQHRDRLGNGLQSQIFLQNAPQRKCYPQYAGDCGFRRRRPLIVPDLGPSL